MKKYVSVLFCENCHNFAKLEASIFNGMLTFKLENDSDFELLESSLSADHLLCKCQNCNSYKVYPIDGEIFEYIFKLNQMGYCTNYSCWGHRPTGNSYIKFANISADKRKNFVNAYLSVSNNPEFKDILNMIYYEYRYFDHTSEDFIDVDINKDCEARLAVGFMYAREVSEMIPSYEECRELFWEFIREIIRILKNEGIV